MNSEIKDPQQYRIMKIPVNRDKSVMYYYKRYEKLPENDESLLDIPADRSIYLCHFLREIDETFVQKFFGQVGKIRQIHFGVYKNKACNKRSKRTIYFAIIVFKKPSDCEAILANPKLIQKIVNKTTKKHVKSAFD